MFESTLPELISKDFLTVLDEPELSIELESISSTLFSSF